LPGLNTIIPWKFIGIRRAGSGLQQLTMLALIYASNWSHRQRQYNNMPKMSEPYHMHIGRKVSGLVTACFY